MDSGAAVVLAAGTIADTTAATTFASTSYTPVVNRLYLVLVVHSDTAPEATVPTVAQTTGLTWVQVGSSIAFDTIASNVHRVTLFRAMKSSGLVAGTHTVTFGDNATGCASCLIEVSGVVTTGVDGADAVRNVSTNVADASADPSVTMAGAFVQNPHVVNGTLIGVGLDINTAPTANANMAILHTGTYASPTTGICASWGWTNLSAPGVTVTTSDWAAIAIELVAAKGPYTNNYTFISAGDGMSVAEKIR